MSKFDFVIHYLRGLAKPDQFEAAAAFLEAAEKITHPKRLIAFLIVVDDRYKGHPAPGQLRALVEAIPEEE